MRRQDFTGRKIQCIIPPDDTSNTPPDADNYCLDTDVYYIPPHFAAPSGPGHGTCMLSKIVGNSYGVATAVTAVMVRVSFRESTDSWRAASTAALASFKRRKARGLQSHAVVSMSVYWPAQQSSVSGSLGYPPTWEQDLLQVLTDMANERMVLVAASGNTGEVSH